MPRGARLARTMLNKINTLQGTAPAGRYSRATVSTGGSGRRTRVAEPNPWHSDLAVLADAGQSLKIEVREQPLRHVQRALRHNAIGGKSGVRRREHPRGAGVRLKPRQPGRLANRGRLDRENLVFERPGRAADPDPMIAGKGPGAGGRKQDLRPGLGERPCNQRKFNVVADRNPELAIGVSKTQSPALAPIPHCSASKRVMTVFCRWALAPLGPKSRA